MRERVLDTLQDLLAMESDLHSDMSTIIRYTRRRLEAAGMRVKQVAPNIQPSSPPTAERDAFAGHLDTVPVGSNWAMFQGEIEATGSTGGPRT